jgi:response regulator RpfG family c-di-GMP phosphodiesterase
MSDGLPMMKMPHVPRKLRVLTVDDEPVCLSLLQAQLADDYEVLTAESGEVALALAHADNPPDIVILDIEMPGLDGFEVCRRLKKHLGTRSIPVVLLSSHGESAAIVRGFEAGAVDYITKPVDADVLRGRLKKHLELKHYFRGLEDIVRARNQVIQYAQGKLEKLIGIGIDMGRERDRMALLRKILFGGREIANCTIGTLFLKTERDTLSFALRTNEDELPDFEVPLYHPASGEPMVGYVSSYAALHNETVVIQDVYQETRFDLSGTIRFSEESGFRTVSMLTVPLAPRDGKVIGVLQFLNALDPKTGEVTTFKPDVVNFVQGLAAQAAVTLDNFQLVEAQRALMDSLIQLIAGAIDTKSPYTGGHCERVPELAMMLAEAATQANTGPLADFAFRTEEEWREFRIGAWLHDCGKVTTPEYVVDKATKLETIHNRIHEIRTRFEVLLRDADIDRLKAIHEQGVAAEVANARFAARKAELEADYAFVAECNLGGEFMAPERVDRIRQIGAQTWQRHFDDRIGLSHEELKRFEAEPVLPLPAEERLLADKPRHLMARTDHRVLDPKYRFQLKVPAYLYNHGELHNLAISRGTLTDEERFKINEHIIQTVVMLEQLPFPADLKRVPEYAGTHHETLTGSGYPRKLAAGDLSVPARIMAIADIFEALTASDRPYKKAKSLSEAVKILSFFKRDQHIDPDLFDLFLTSGIYQRYGERFLAPEQLDEVDIAHYLG